MTDGNEAARIRIPAWTRKLSCRLLGKYILKRMRSRATMSHVWILRDLSNTNKTRQYVWALPTRAAARSLYNLHRTHPRQLSRLAPPEKWQPRRLNRFKLVNQFATTGWRARYFVRV